MTDDEMEKALDSLELKGWDLIDWRIWAGEHPTDADLADAFAHGPPSPRACAYLQALYERPDRIQLLGRAV